jgi:Immunity protein Imm1
LSTGTPSSTAAGAIFLSAMALFWFVDSTNTCSHSIRMDVAVGEDRAVTDVTVEWGRARRAVVGAVEDLDRVLDGIDREGRASRMPQDVQLTSSAGDGTLGIVVGSDRSVLNYVPASGDPPYLSSIGDEREDRAFTFWVAGDHHSESAWQHTIPTARARAAARHFLLTGRLDPRVGWTEV